MSACPPQVTSRSLRAPSPPGAAHGAPGPGTARHGTERCAARPALHPPPRCATTRRPAPSHRPAPPRHGSARLGTYPPPRALARHGSPPARPDCCCEVQGPQGTGSREQAPCTARRAVLRAPVLCGRGARNPGCTPIPAQRLRVHTSGWFGAGRGGRLCSSVAAGVCDGLEIFTPSASGARVQPAATLDIQKREIVLSKRHFPGCLCSTIQEQAL